MKQATWSLRAAHALRTGGGIRSLATVSGAAASSRVKHGSRQCNPMVALERTEGAMSLNKV
ncbi:hypothetical protein GGI11_008782, partial [Coemansia sp. RSA 2049]